MGSTLRTETYLYFGRLVAVEVRRPSGRGPWSKPNGFSTSSLVAIVEGSLGNTKLVTRGQLATDALLADSLLLHSGRDPSFFDRQLWQSVPQSLLHGVKSDVANAVEAVAKAWSQFANEEAITGAVFSRLAGSTRQESGWQAEIQFVEFSKQKKEPETGADVALLLDILALDGRRAIKTIWLQAKRQPKVPGMWQDLPRMKDQMAKMRTFTQSSFGLVYTPSGARVVGPSLPAGVQTLDDLIDAGLRCLAGDQAPSLYAQSINRLSTGRIFMTQVR